MFCPGAPVTREQMATFLVRALDLPAGSASFVDVGGVHEANIGALAAAGWYRTKEGQWTNTPLIEGSALNL